MKYQTTGGSITIEGGRTGVLKYDGGEHQAELEWEMLVGDVPMVIYGERSIWTAPHARKMTKDEVRRVAVELATAMGVHLDLSFSDGDERVGAAP